ncbi:hypothetical protein CLV56_2482 [Mumia flava]|uniref:Uncharacterized protein n=1 Tax=Mumia flava TaxID=1348852 RepID=A0A0B2BE15_9ACTN|nr:DUF3303 family protein [Mumia flava]PJJ58235.1 hypothetical protein CLV56_2482 [Mumia flava]
MILVTTYRIKPFLSKAETKELLGAFAEVGNAPGTTAHYVFADGGGGVVVAESDDPMEGYRNLLNYSQWISFDTKVMLKVDDAVPMIMESLS